MFNKKAFRLASLVLALGLLLGLVVTGCSEKCDCRCYPYPYPTTSPSPSPDPSPVPPSSGGLLYYHFSLEKPLAKGIYGTPTHVVVSATDADEQPVEVTTVPDPVYIPDMELDDEGYYVIETTYGEDATNVVFTFTHEEDGQYIYDDQREVDVTKLDVVDEVYADAKEVENEVNVETLDNEGKPALVFKAGTEFYAKVWFGPKGSPENVSAFSNVKLSSSSDAVEVGEYDPTTNAIACKAVDKADKVTLSVAIDGVVAKDVASLCVQKDPQHLHYMIEGDSYIDEVGHIIAYGVYPVESVSQIETVEMYIGGQETCTIRFQAVIHYGDDEEGYPLFKTAGVPDDANVIIEDLETEGFKVTGTYEDGYMTIHCELQPGAVDPWLTVNVGLSADSYTSDTCHITLQEEK